MLKAIVQNETVTNNGMAAYRSTNSACLDLFYKIGASRGKDITQPFFAAYQENRELALRIALWARDARGGAGERQVFRDILVMLEELDPMLVRLLIPRIPELGRWDDLLVFKTNWVKSAVYSFIAVALEAGDRLCAKWMPRKGPVAAELRRVLGKSPREYRKYLVERTHVVESQMCARQWDRIVFDTVPSLASARYRKAFWRNAEEAYRTYVEGLANKTRKVHGNLFPHDVVRSVLFSEATDPAFRALEEQMIEAQWAALPTYLQDARILPLVDVSGSMTSSISGKLRAMDVAISLGLYCASKNTGPFSDLVMTFSEIPTLLSLKGSVVEKVRQLESAPWGMNTDFAAALQELLSLAQRESVPQSEMPEVLLVLSDMQFDSVGPYRSKKTTALAEVREKYVLHGYTPPTIVFWNLKDEDNVPATLRHDNTVLVSGYSPALLKSLLATLQAVRGQDAHARTQALQNLSQAMMYLTVDVPRYDPPASV